MSTKLVLVLLAVVLLIGAVFFFVAGGRGGSGRGTPAPIAPAEPAESLATDTAELTPAAPVETPVRAEARVTIDAPVESPRSPRAELAGMTGRVVESDSAPVAGIRVALVEFDASVLFDGAAIGAEEAKLELEETVTDAEGRFLLGGARAASFHGLGIDLGGPRATVRVLEHALIHREQTDVGDVVLAPYGVVTGRVVDESGAPVAGARVRFGPFPADVLQASPFDFRSDSLIAVSMLAMGGEGQGIIEPPGWVRGVIDRFPIPTTESGDDGTFRLQGVALAMLIGGVDKRGYVGVGVQPIDVKGGTYDVGTVVLKRGRTIRGVVEESSGDPAAGVEVFAGAELFPGVAAILQSCGLTDEEGHFELTGVPETGQIVATARRAKHEAWSTTLTARPDNVLVEIESTVSLTVNVRDERGEPISGADIRLAPGRPAGENNAFLGFLAFLPKPIAPSGTFAEFEPGRYRNEHLGAGLYDVTARVRGLAPALQQVECRSSESEITLICPVGRRVELTVVDAATKAPIQGARASVMRASGAGFVKLAVESTDREGRALLGPLPDFSGEPPASDFMPSETLLQVQHPRHGEYSATLDPSVSPLVVELHSGGVLEGRVHWAGAVPTSLYMLALEYRGAGDGFLEIFHLPRLALTDLEGKFRVTNLAPGKYNASLTERFLQQDPLGLISMDFEPPTLHEEELEIVDGQTTELVIDLTPTGRGALARVIGHVRYDGRNLEGAEVRVNGNEDLHVTTDSSGRFETAPFSVRGNTWINIEGDVRLANGSTQRTQLYSENVELHRDDVHDIQLDLYPLTLRAKVVSDSTGDPVRGASVQAQFQADAEKSYTFDQKNLTDDAGEVELIVFHEGDYLLTVSAEGFGKAQGSAKVAGEGKADAELIRLPPSVPCAGRVELTSTDASGGFAYLWVHGVENPCQSGSMLSPPERTFTLEGLTAGKYKGQIYWAGRQGEEFEFELGPQGDEDMVLFFTPSED